MGNRVRQIAPSHRKYNGILGVLEPDQKQQVIGFCGTISQRYPDAAAAKTAADPARELERSAVVKE